MTTAHNLLMLGYPGAQLLDIAGPLQMFAAVNDALGHQAYRIEIAAPEAGPFATSSGVSLIADLSLAHVTSKRLARTDTLMVAGGDPGTREQLVGGAITEIVKKAEAACRACRRFAAAPSSWRRPACSTAGAPPLIGKWSSR